MINVIDISQFRVKLKATIHTSGRLGFTKDTADFLGLSSLPYVLFANDDEDPEQLYMALVDEELPNSMKVNVSGKYFYIQTNLLFDNLGYDYKKKTIMFDLIREPKYDEVLSGKTYRMNVRYGKNKKTK